MKRDPPENIFYSVHIALLNIFSKPGLVQVSRLVNHEVGTKLISVTVQNRVM